MKLTEAQSKWLSCLMPPGEMLKRFLRTAAGRKFVDDKTFEKRFYHFIAGGKGVSDDVAAAIWRSIGIVEKDLALAEQLKPEKLEKKEKFDSRRFIENCSKALWCGVIGKKTVNVDTVEASYGVLSSCAIKSMQAFGRRFPNAGYGGSFVAWLQDKNPRPYNRWGNGAAMRVSACGWAGRTIDEVKAMSRSVTEVTHNHPEGIRGAEATAVATFLARSGKSMADIRKVVVSNYYRLNFSLDEIRDNYKFDVSCRGSVPQALEAFFESTSFEDAIRNAISIGGDSDTIGAICGAVAGVYYGVPDNIRTKAMSFLVRNLAETLDAFEHCIGEVRS